MVYIFLADGFEEIEAIAPLDILRRANVEVCTAGVTGMSVASSHGLVVQADISLDKVTLDGCEMIVLPGGSVGVDNMKASRETLELVRQADSREILLAAICAGPEIFAELGMLKGRRAVCYPTCEGVLEEHGARIQRDECVVHDRHIITAQAAGSSVDFGLQLVSMLRGWKAAEDVRKKMYYNPHKNPLT